MRINSKVFAAGLVPVGLLWAAQVNHLRSELIKTHEVHQHQVDSITGEKDIRIQKLEDHIFKLQVELELCK